MPLPTLLILSDWRILVTTLSLSKDMTFFLYGLPHLSPTLCCCSVESKKGSWLRWLYGGYYERWQSSLTLMDRMCPFFSIIIFVWLKEKKGGGLHSVHTWYSSSSQQSSKLSLFPAPPRRSNRCRISFNMANQHHSEYFRKRGKEIDIFTTVCQGVVGISVLVEYQLEQTIL